MTDLLNNYHHGNSLQSQAPHHHPKKLRTWSWFTVVKAIFLCILAAVAIGLVVIGFNLKHVAAISSGVIQGKSKLESALYTAQSGDLKTASIQADEAVKSFQAAETELDKVALGPLVFIPIVKNYKADTDHLIAGGASLADAMRQATGYASKLEDVIGKNGDKGFSKLPVDEKRKILAAIYDAPATLTAVEASLDKSLEEVSAAKSFDWLAPLQSRIDELKDKIANGKKTLSAASPLTRLLPPLLGYPDPASYLFILQNSDELRPTGGFIGTYGIIQTKDGDVTRFDTHDIYHLDMPIKDKVTVTPPEPIKKYLVDKWYLRDANWSPDWPTSAEKVLWFYDKENSAMDKPDPARDFDGVIAVTPELITELMKLTGPITVEGETYTPENFVDLLQYRVEKNYVQLGVSSWHRKEVIGQIAGVLKERLFDLPLGRWNELIRLVGDNMARKNILLYAKDDGLEKLIREQGWSGEMRHTWGDYLMAVDANMGALKTDAVMKRHIDYKIEQGSDGQLTATVTLNYSNPGGPSWKTSRYQSYTRIYVPQGSTLIKASGAADGSVTSGDELDKTNFGAYVTVPLRGTAQLSFQYKLPRRMSENMDTYRNYGLLMQKQPGTGAVTVTVDARFNNEIKSYNPSNLYTKTPEPNRFTTQGDLTIDRNFLINF